MGRGIIKIKDKYFEWSTIVDAPVTYGMSLDELTEYVKNEYGDSELTSLPSRLEQVDRTGTSFPAMTLQEVISCNRAGDNEKHLRSATAIYNRYGGVQC